MRTALRTSSRLLLCLGLAGVAAVGCTRDRREPARGTPAAPPAPGPAAATTPTTTPPPSTGADRITGTVVETMDAGGYTYAKIDRGGSQVWAAGPATKLAVGARVDTDAGTLMTGFRSETLDRTFEEIYFIASFGDAGGAPANPHAEGAAPVATSAPLDEKIAPAAGGMTIAAVYAGKATLAGKEITVRAKVVKVNNEIMGRNWLHLRDGSGAAGTNDLLITSSATAAVGDVIVARGTLATDKDYGGGYRYALVVENSTLAAK